MSARRRTSLLVAALAMAAGACAGDNADLGFAIEDGAVSNAFYRQGPVAAHIVLKSAAAPRLVIAFPAGNSGTGVWFASQDKPVVWDTARDVRPVTQTLGDGAVRRGVRFETVASSGFLEVEQAILSNVRVLRDYGYTGKIPVEVAAAPSIGDGRIEWERRRLDGGAGYFLSIEALNGEAKAAAGEGASLRASNGRSLRLRITALTGEPPLTGLSGAALLTASAAKDARLRDVLSFLAYEEKLLAGSWQYNTYFGRDTLMTIALLGEALAPAAVEAGFASVLDRLSATGEVAHEEDIGEYALLRRAGDGPRTDDSPILDYKMIDDDFMLAPALAHYLLDRKDGRARAERFLGRKGPGGDTYAALLRRNLDFVIAAAGPYGEEPHWSRFIGLRVADPPVGNWRDSNAGLGGGVYPYDVNAALVPAALAAARRLFESGLIGEDSAARAADAARLSAVWSASPAHFDIDAGARFAAIALDRDGAPIPIMHSDTGFRMLFGAPSDDELQSAAAAVTAPYPAGLMTPAGLVVANASYAPAAMAAQFGPDRYHGAVIWSWQQGMMAAGLARQLRREDLTGTTRLALQGALDAVTAAIRTARDYQASELWSWTKQDGEVVRVPFGQGEADETESNAAQLWSTIHLFMNGDHSASGLQP